MGNHQVGKAASKAIPILLTIASSVGVAGTAFLFARAGMKAERKVLEQSKVTQTMRELEAFDTVFKSLEKEKK